MKKSRLLGAVCAYLSVSSFNASAEIVSVDWLTPGDNFITRDTVSGQEWLDLTVTKNMSYNNVSAQLGVGGTFEGWSYATRVQVSGFWDAFGGDSAHYDGWSTQNNELFDAVAPFWGDLGCEFTGCNPGEGLSWAITADVPEAGKHHLAYAWDSLNHHTEDDANGDIFDLSDILVYSNTSFEAGVGSALVRAVPIPPALWLFGSGLLGLVGMAGRGMRS